MINTNNVTLSEYNKIKKEEYVAICFENGRREQTYTSGLVDVLNEIKRQQRIGRICLILSPSEIKQCGIDDTNRDIKYFIEKLNAESKGNIRGFEYTIGYAGKTMNLVSVYDERTEPKWSTLAQDRINAQRALGKKACCIHHGDLHGYYEERVEKLSAIVDTSRGRPELEMVHPEDCECGKCTGEDAAIDVMEKGISEAETNYGD